MCRNCGNKDREIVCRLCGEEQDDYVLDTEEYRGMEFPCYDCLCDHYENNE